MSRAIVKNLALIAAGALVACTTAFAGGPLAIYDPATKTPYAWAGAQAPVYTDLGTLGPLTGDQANAMTLASIEQWNAVVQPVVGHTRNCRKSHRLL